MPTIRAQENIGRLQAFIIDGVNWCNPITWVDTGQLAMFAARRDIAVGEEITQDDFWPVLNADGPYKNVHAGPPESAWARRWK